MTDVEVAKFKVGDKVRFTIEGEVLHIMTGDPGAFDEGRVCYMLRSGYVLLSEDRDRGRLVKVRRGFWAMIADWLDYTFGGHDNF